jgi:scyllo-inositol 2-dehydrogenase (NADP+)
MIRFAVIGTNWITERLIEAASHEKDFKLEAVYSRTKEQALAFAEKHNVQTIFTDIDELAKSDQIDAVYIASPNAFHAEQAIKLMKHGKHILCEKPLASNTKEVQSMIDTAEANHVVLMEALYTTCLPNFQIIKSNLERLGPIRRYVANYCKISSRYDAYKEGTILNAFNPAFSNGALMDLGVYGVYPMVALFGPPNAIKANGFLLESGVDGQGSVIASYDGMEGVIMHSKISNSHLPSEIQGEEGTLVIDLISSLEKVAIHWRDGRVESLSQDQEFPSMYYEVAEFVSCIKEGRLESKLNSLRTTYTTTMILEEARRQMGVVYPADQ